MLRLLNDYVTVRSYTKGCGTVQDTGPKATVKKGDEVYFATDLIPTDTIDHNRVSGELVFITRESDLLYVESPPPAGVSQVVSVGESASEGVWAEVAPPDRHGRNRCLPTGYEIVPRGTSPERFDMRVRGELVKLERDTIAEARAAAWAHRDRAKCDNGVKEWLAGDGNKPLYLNPSDERTIRVNVVGVDKAELDKLWAEVKAAHEATAAQRQVLEDLKAAKRKACEQALATGSEPDKAIASCMSEAAHFFAAGDARSGLASLLAAATHAEMAAFSGAVMSDRYLDFAKRVRDLSTYAKW